jgi:hypothetical protein
MAHHGGEKINPKLTSHKPSESKAIENPRILPLLTANVLAKPSLHQQNESTALYWIWNTPWFSK